MTRRQKLLGNTPKWLLAHMMTMNRFEEEGLLPCIIRMVGPPASTEPTTITATPT